MKNTMIIRYLMALLSWYPAAVAHSRFYAQQKLDAMADATCRIEPVNYMGWQAQQVSNKWVKLIFVPQNGGRLMQILFDGHPFLFVNHRYAGQYFPPSAGQWFNYGGDKLWVLPEGNDDEKHWVGNSDVLDDGPYAFRILSQGQRCEVALTGSADSQTGLQFTRTVSLGVDSPRISFHAVMNNSTAHPIEWSMQSVSQYDTADVQDSSRHNPNFWAFSSVNPSSSYLNRYHVRFGPAENSSVQVRENGLFALHYVHLAAELWLDSADGWLAVVDGASGYAMVERFRYDQTKRYPGKASVIFWTNGPQLRLNPDGTATFGSLRSEPPPFYMEAEINSPMVRLYPGESYGLDTEWFPTRAESDFQGVRDSGVIFKPFHATQDPGTSKINIFGAFGVFFSGKLVANLYDTHGTAIGTQLVAEVDPSKLVLLRTTVRDPGGATRISLHLVDPRSGLDRGALGEVPVEVPTGNQ